MRFWPRTLAGQLIALLLAALAVSQIVAFLIYNGERAQALREADRIGLLENTASVLRMLYLAPAEQRARLAAAASSPRVRIWTSEESVAAAGPVATFGVQISRLFGEAIAERARLQVIREEGAVAAPAVRGEGVMVPGTPVTATPGTPIQTAPDRVGFAPVAGSRFDILLSVPFPDGGWLNAQTQIRAEPINWPWASSMSALVMVIAILAIVAFTARRATRPLRALATRADALGRGTPEPPLVAEGPNEIRSLTDSFNRMQERLGRFVTDRTRMLAAIGHDLRTPITSLKLRAELLDDAEEKTKMLATLDEMQAMIEATLSFAREDAAHEPPRTVDLSALVAAAVDDHADLGKDVRFAESARLAYRCRPTALKRAVSNLIDNAVRYGERARVSLIESEDGPVIAVEDRGPGIPPDEIDEAFQPFVRLEASRSRETGGVGLGLAIARSIVLSHGGELTLANRPEGGLRAEIRLPKAEGAARS